MIVLDVIQYNQVIRRVIVAFLFTLLYYNSFAQLNESDTSKIHLKIGINGIRQTGNVDLGIVRARLEFTARLSKHIAFKSQNNSLYQEFSSFKADNDINSKNYLYFKPEKRIYPFAMAYIQSNFRLKIQQRFFYGAGATIQLVRKENHSLKVSTSIVYETTKYATNQFNEMFYSGSNVIELFRPTLYLAGSHTFGNQKLSFHYTASWQPGITEAFNHRIQAEAGLEINFWKRLSITCQYLTIYEQVVPSNIKQRDAIFTVGVNYQLRK